MARPTCRVKHAASVTLSYSSMESADMLVNAQNSGETVPATTTQPGEMNVDDCFDAVSPSVEAMTLEEIDIVDSDFTWSTVSPRPSTPASDAYAPASSASIEESTEEKETATSTKLTTSAGAQTEVIPQAPMQKHSSYFWDFIMFKVRIG